MKSGMSPLHASLAATIFAFALAGCARDAPAAKKDPTPAPKTEAHGLALGAPIPAGATNVALADVAKNPDAYKGKSITTTGTVTAVCQHMGCWMEIKDDATEAHIKLAGEKFFVPKTSTVMYCSMVSRRSVSSSTRHCSRLRMESMAIRRP